MKKLSESPKKSAHSTLRSSTSPVESLKIGDNTQRVAGAGVPPSFKPA